jgi:hypothetical protein
MSKCGHNMALELTAPHLLKRVGARRSRCGARQVGAATQLDVMTPENGDTYSGDSENEVCGKRLSVQGRTEKCENENRNCMFCGFL